MTNHTGDGSDVALQRPSDATLRLFSVVGREELYIRRTDYGLKIIKTVYHSEPTTVKGETERADWETEGIMVKQYTERINLAQDAVLLMYTMPTNTDVSTQWHIRVISRGENIDYNLQSEQDAFAFQTLVTGYTPHWRIRNVFASALERHTWTRSTDIESDCELQLWSFQPSEPAKPSKPRNDGQFASPPNSPATLAAQLGQSSRIVGSTLGSASGSTPSLPATPPRTVVRTVVEKDLGSRGITVTMASPRPLLVLFGKGKKPADGKYQIWRVDIRNLRSRLDSRPESDPKVLELVAADPSPGSAGGLQPFPVEILEAKDLQSWDVSRIRPWLYSRYFKAHSCHNLRLRFKGLEDIRIFKEGLEQLRGTLATPASSRPPSHLAGSERDQGSVNGQGGIAGQESQASRERQEGGEGEKGGEGEAAEGITPSIVLSAPPAGDGGDTTRPGPPTRNDSSSARMHENSSSSMTTVSEYPGGPWTQNSVSRWTQDIPTTIVEEPTGHRRNGGPVAQGTLAPRPW